MRWYQEVGLTGEALSFLRENVVQVPAQTCPHCGEVLNYKDKIVSTVHVDMFYGDGPDLETYELKDGRLATEVVQCSPWSSGPMAFLCLEIDGKRMFEWSDEDIEKQM